MSTITPPQDADWLVQQIGDSDDVRSILEVVCRTTGMGYAAVAHVTEDRWVACQVKDDLDFGLKAGGELPIKTTLCDTVRGTKQTIVIDRVETDPVYHDHHTPRIYALQSYIAEPIILDDGEVFGTLCAIDRVPRTLNTPTVLGMFSLFAKLIATRIERIRSEAQKQSLGRRVADVLEQKKVYADIVDSSTASITALALDWSILAINSANVSAFQRVYGKRPQVGDNFLNLFPVPEHAEQQKAIWSRALAGEDFVVIQEFGDARIERRSYEVRFSPLLNSAGERIGASSTSYDVTDRVRAEAELAAAQEQLRQAQKMEALGQLTGGVAHDFNNVLTPIVGSLDLLQRHGVGGDKEQRLISAAQQSAERARLLVQRLLAFARRQPLQPTAVNISALVASMAELVSSTLGPQIKVETEIAPRLPHAHADVNQLEMALINLSVNARDAMPDGGTLRIAAALDTIGAGHPTSLPPGSYVRLTVADSGFGMDEETLARAVEPFFSTKGIGKGTGLGLSMVDGLARQLGGAIALSSKAGSGTDVSLWLRVSQAPAGNNIEAPANSASSSETGVVLLVDDEMLVRLTTASMLEELGYSIVEASSAEEALQQLGSGLQPDFVVTDHLMPGMTGAELARQLSAKANRIPTLIVTGFARASDIDPTFARLSKPFRKDQLAASLRAIRR